MRGWCATAGRFIGGNVVHVGSAVADGQDGILHGTDLSFFVWCTVFIKPVTFAVDRNSASNQDDQRKFGVLFRGIDHVFIPGTQGVEAAAITGQLKLSDEFRSGFLEG